MGTKNIKFNAMQQNIKFISNSGLYFLDHE